MSYKDLSFAAFKAAKAFLEDELDDIATCWPNINFTPPDNEPFAIVSILPVNSVPVTIGIGGQDEHKEILQISLYFPMQVGECALVDAISATKDYFAAGSTSTYNGSTVIFTKTQTTPRMRQDNRYFCHVSIYWRGRTDRPSTLIHN